MSSAGTRRQRRSRTTTKSGTSRGCREEPCGATLPPWCHQTRPSRRPRWQKRSSRTIALLGVAGGSPPVDRRGSFGIRAPTRALVVEALLGEALVEARRLQGASVQRAAADDSEKASGHTPLATPSSTKRSLSTTASSSWAAVAVAAVATARVVAETLADPMEHSCFAMNAAAQST